jgi:hypothetical protein
VVPRHPDEVGDGFRNEGRSLIRVAIQGRIIGSGTAIPARGCVRSPAPCFGQKITSSIVCLANMPFLREQLSGAVYNFFDARGFIGSDGSEPGPPARPTQNQIAFRLL